MRRLLFGLVIGLFSLVGCGHDPSQHLFIQAVQVDDVLAMQRALHQGAKINGTDRQGWAALHWAVRQQRPKALRLLLKQKDLNVSAKGQGGATPLHLGVAYWDAPMVKLLLSRGALVNSKLKTGETPLHTAVLRSDGHLVSLLLAHGAKPDAKDGNGNTPYSLARSHPELAKLFGQFDRDSIRP